MLQEFNNLELCMTRSTCQQTGTIKVAQPRNIPRNVCKCDGGFGTGTLPTAEVETLAETGKRGSK